MIVGVATPPAYDDAVDARVLIPVKAFRQAKGRLAPVLAPDDRVRLARWTAERVLAAAGELPVAVVCDDHDVADWARSHGATVLWEEHQGLNGAVDHAVATLRIGGCRHVIVVHGDLARPTTLADVVRPGTVTLVPDRHLDGTNVMSFPTDRPMHAAYGAGSFRRHLAAALERGGPVGVVRDRFLALDIDDARDLAHPLVQEVLPTWLRTNPASRSPR